MVKRFLIGIVTVVSFTAVTVGCLNNNTTTTETTTETTVNIPTPIITPTPTVTPTPTPVPQKMEGEDISRELNSSEGFTYYITHYCACTYCCGPNAQGICADGTPVSEDSSDHSAAADPSIPFGTRFIIPELSGNEVYTVHDRGSGVHGNHFDLFQGSHDEALNSPSGYYTVYFIN